MSMPLPVLHCPKFVRDKADSFKGCFKRKGVQYQAFTAALCAAIYGIGSCSDMFRYLQFSPSVTSLSEMFAIAGLAARLNRRHRRQLLRLLKDLKTDPNRYRWAFDDTIVQHYGETIWAAYTWHDHVINAYVNGHRILTLGIVDTKHRLFIPVFWEVLHRDLGLLVEGGKPDPNHEKHWQVALRLMDAAHKLGFPKLTTVADSGFAGEEMFEALKARQLEFVLEIKCNRKVIRHGRKALSQSVTEFFKGRERHPIQYRGKTKFAAEAIVQLKDAKESIKVVAVANHRNSDDNPFAYYVTNQKTWNASQVWGVSRDRWGIEVQFRDLKQSFTFGEAAVRSRDSVETTLSIAMIALTAIRLEQIAEAERSGNQRRWPPPAGSIVRDLQLNSLLQGVSKLSAPHQGKLRETFNARLNHRNLNGKPVDLRRRRVDQPKREPIAPKPVPASRRTVPAVIRIPQTRPLSAADARRRCGMPVRECVHRRKVS